MNDLTPDEKRELQAIRVRHASVTDDYVLCKEDDTWALKYGVSEADATFIEHAQGDIDVLLELVDDLVRKNEALRSQMEGMLKAQQIERLGYDPDEPRVNPFIPVAERKNPTTHKIVRTEDGTEVLMPKPPMFHESQPVMTPDGPGEIYAITATAIAVRLNEGTCLGTYAPHELEPLESK